MQLFDSPLGLAIIAMMAIGAADAINKKARQAGIPINSYLLIQSPVFTTSILIITIATTGIRINQGIILFALAGTLLSLPAFVLMLNSLTIGYASINYAIFRLGFVFSSMAAIVLLNETLTLTKLSGIIIAALAILLFFIRPNQLMVHRQSLLLALAGMILVAIYQFVLKLATLQIQSLPSFILMMSIFFTSGVIFYAIFTGCFTFHRPALRYAPFNGLLMSLGTLSMILALSKGEASTVLPIVQLSFLVTVIVSVGLLKEKINYRQVAGIIGATIAIITLAFF